MAPVMQTQRAVTLARQLLEAAASVRADERELWLPRFLELAKEASRASFVYLGETRPRGLLRTAWWRDRLVRREDERLLGVSRRVALRDTSIVESTLRRGGAFRPTADGWEGVTTAGYAMLSIPFAGSRRAWLAALRVESDPAFDSDTLEILDLVARGIGSALQLESRLAELDSLAMTDGLTAIPNYRFLRLALDHELARAHRDGQVFSVVMVDVDNLKQYNSTHGHLLGSDLLRTLAQLLRAETRASDIVTRYGGDEFLLILPKTDGEGAQILSERLRQAVVTRMRGRGGETVSCSFGVASFPVEGRDFESLVSSADTALRQAKEEGRNLVVGGGVRVRV